MFPSELDAVDELAQEHYGLPLMQLPIGKAVTALRALAVDCIINDPKTAVIDAEDHSVVVTSSMDGPEAVETTFLKHFDESVPHSLRTSGRLVIDVISMADRGLMDAEPVQTYEIHSQARRAALNEVGALLHSYGERLVH